MTRWSAEKRRLIGLTINQSVPVPDMADVRAYASVWLVPTSGGMRLLADADAAGGQLQPRQRADRVGRQRCATRATCPRWWT